ncbi:hypothetical protein BJV77DRAFT_967143 [Russula vinacea]|nr:hypothetical protein BJV77DRAFT_967143 [Russula vinacea]
MNPLRLRRLTSMADSTVMVQDRQSGPLARLVDFTYAITSELEQLSPASEPASFWPNDEDVLDDTFHKDGFRPFLHAPVSDHIGQWFSFGIADKVPRTFDPATTLSTARHLRSAATSSHRATVTYHLYFDDDECEPLRETWSLNPPPCPRRCGERAQFLTTFDSEALLGNPQFFWTAARSNSDCSTYIGLS